MAIVQIQSENDIEQHNPASKEERVKSLMEITTLRMRIVYYNPFVNRYPFNQGADTCYHPLRLIYLSVAYLMYLSQ